MLHGDARSRPGIDIEFLKTAGDAILAAQSGLSNIQALSDESVRSMVGPGGDASTSSGWPTAFACHSHPQANASSSILQLEKRSTA